MNNYVVINQQNEIVNAILWDGVSDYNPGDGVILVASGETAAPIGGVYDAAGPHKFIPPNPGGEAVYNATTNIWDMPPPFEPVVAVNPNALPAT